MAVVNQAQQSVTDLLKLFMQVQQQRAEHYSSMHQAFRTFLSTRQEPVFRHALQEATAGFNSCSKQVIFAETCLKQELQRPDLAALLRVVQEQEREKLRLTLSLQSLKQALAFETFSWQHEEDVDILEPKAPRTCGCSSAPALSPGQTQAGSHSAHHSHTHDHAIAEPTEAEYNSAVKEAQLLLDEHIREINAKIEEVREILLDVKDQA